MSGENGNKTHVDYLKGKASKKNEVNADKN